MESLSFGKHIENKQITDKPLIALFIILLIDNTILDYSNDVDLDLRLGQYFLALVFCNKNRLFKQFAK